MTQASGATYTVDNSSDTEPTRSPSSPSNSWSSAETATFPSGGLQDGPEPRRPKRCKISREQLSVLISSFEDEPLPNFDQRQTLAKHLNMTPRSVQIWFQNRRQRLKPAQARPPSLYSGGGVANGLASHRPQQSSQQHFGMPGLAAVAGLCSGSTAGFDSLMNHALAQQQAPMQQQVTGRPSGQGGPTYGGGAGSQRYGDVMEPFAITRALNGYNPYEREGGAQVDVELQHERAARSRDE